jgi:PA domain
MLAAGNDGFFGLYYASAASAGKDVTSVGSVDNINTPDLTPAGHYIVNGSSTEFPYAAAVGALSTFNGITLPISVDTFDTTIVDDGCNGFTKNFTGTIALIRRGTCSFAEKAQSAIDAGAQYVMFYNNIATPINPFVGGATILGQLHALFC